MVSGTPVAVSRATVFPEICEKAAAYFDPRDAKDVADKLELILDDPDVRHELVREGFKQAEKLSWDRNAQLMLEVFAQVMGTNNAPAGF
jgi:glycosyltransferase involved in cell wall biosynthesis